MASPEPIQRPAALVRAIYLMAAIVVLTAGMKAASTIFVPFLLALFFTVILTPLYLLLRDWRVPTALSLLITVAFAIGVGLAGVGLIAQSVGAFSAKLPEYQQSLSEQTDRLIDWLEAQGLEEMRPAVANVLNPQVAMGFAGDIVKALGGMIGQAFLILILMVFMLLEVAVLPRKFRGLPGMTEDTWQRMHGVVSQVRRYTAIKTGMSLLTGGLVVVWLWFMGVENPFVLGLLAFALNYVPNIGSIIAAAPGVLLALIEFGVGRGVVVGVGYIVINVGVSNFLEPRVMGRGLDLSPLVILLSLVFWGWVFGPIGMLLSIPLSVGLRVALECDPRTVGAAVLLGEGTKLPVEPPPPDGGKPASA